MEKSISMINFETIARQRNLFVGLTLFLCASMLLLSIKLATLDEKTILVPGLTQEVWTKEGGVSASYLEESTLMYLPLLLDLNAEIIDHKAQVIFKYVSQSEASYMKKLQNYFAEAAKKYKQFALSTYFSVKNLEVDTKKLSVKANGVLTSRYGTEGFETTKISYLLKFEWIGGKLRLKEFEQYREENLKEKPE